MLERADVVIENFRPGVMEQLGYGWETLHARYPSVIYASISGYGHTGPAANQPAYDMVIQAASGLMSITGEEGRPPCRAGISLADAGAGLFAAIAVNAALFDRQRTGRTTMIDLSMFDCMLTLLENPLARYLMTGVVGTRMGSAHPGIMPFEAFATSDGYIAIAGARDKFFNALCKAIDRHDLAIDERYASNVLRVEHRPQLKAQLESKLTLQTTAHWVELLGRAGVPASAINDIAQAVAHPQVAARNMVVEAVDPVLGPLKMVGSPFKMSAFDDPPDRRIAPDLDQDRRQVFADLGVVEGRVPLPHEKSEGGNHRPSP
jgi:CoA:oxalate CoA-transferase